MKLIDKDGLLLQINKELAFGGLSSKALKRIVQRYPAERNAEVVIRCKDCKHWYKKYRHGVDMSACKRAIGYFEANDYCSRAERKEEP